MSQKYGHCPVPNCERRLLSGKSPHGLCWHHEELLDFLLFIMPHIKPGTENPKAPGLILPGHPEFTISKEVIRHRGIKP